MKRRSRRAIELSLDLPYLNPKVKQKWPPPLSEKEIKKLVDQHRSDPPVEQKE